MAAPTGQWKSQTAIANSVDFDTTLTTEFSYDQTNGVILTPSSGARLAIKGIYIGTTATSGEARLTITDSNGIDTVITFYATATAGYVPVLIKGNRNAQLKATTTFGADKNYFILVNYREE